MQAALRIQTTILSGSKIEVIAPQLEPGQQVEVIILFPELSAPMRRSALDILGEAPGHPDSPSLRVSYRLPSSVSCQRSAICLLPTEALWLCGSAVLRL